MHTNRFCLSERFYSSIQSYAAVEPPPDNLPTFLTTDVLRDPKKRY
jgi:hypothetical protein